MTALATATTTTPSAAELRRQREGRTRARADAAAALEQLRQQREWAEVHDGARYITLGPRIRAAEQQLATLDAEVDALQREEDVQRAREARAQWSAERVKQMADYERDVAAIAPALAEFVRTRLRSLRPKAERIAQLTAQLDQQDPAGVMAGLLAAPGQLLTTASRWLRPWFDARHPPERAGVGGIDGQMYAALYEAFFGSGSK